MRWRFADLTNCVEAKRHRALVAKIDDWWQEFAGKTDLLRAHFNGQTQWDLPEWMTDHLQAIHPDLMWEFGPAVHGEGHRLVITPEFRHFLLPLITTILDRAPQLAGWDFYPYRLPEDTKHTKLTVEARVDGYDIGDFRVRVRQGKDHRVDVCYFSPRISDQNDRQASHAAFVTTESLLGEECLNRWIGDIELSPLPSRGGFWGLIRKGAAERATVLPLERLRDTVESLIGSIRDQLPREPHLQWTKGAEWTLWKLSPEQNDDYVTQTDLFVGKSANPPLWTAAHSNNPFFSERFSRCGETFCYLKLDGSEGLDEDGLPTRRKSRTLWTRC